MSMTIEDGFPGQRICSLPRPVVNEALRSPGTSHLAAVASGYFPHAQAHGMTRMSPIHEAVVIVCVSGRGWCEIEGVRHEVEPSHVVILPPDVAHSYGADLTDPWTVWWVHVAGKDLDEFLRATGMGAESPVRPLPELYRTVALVEEVTEWMERDSMPMTLLAASGAAWHLMATIAANLPNRSIRTTAIERTKDYLRHNVQERMSVAELAHRANLSPSHFAALFREQVGTSVLKYQTQLRMAKARELLDLTDWAVARVSEEVGYEDPFYFGRQFKAIHGITPLKYRSQNKG